jgi:hypothetical protein
MKVKVYKDELYPYFFVCPIDPEEKVSDWDKEYVKEIHAEKYREYLKFMEEFDTWQDWLESL